MKANRVIPVPLVTSQVHYFKRLQCKVIYHYYKVVGGPGKTKQGHQIIVNFLNDHPIIAVEHNYVADPSGLTGTWCQFEVGEPITEQEFNRAFNKAIVHPECMLL